MNEKPKFISFKEWLEENPSGQLHEYLEDKRKWEIGMLGFIRATAPKDKCKICDKPLTRSAIEDGYTTCPKHRTYETK
jgi:hypothetical protein